jgi:hypothetical protein
MMVVNLRGIREELKARPAATAGSANSRPLKEVPFAQIFLHWLQRARAASALPLLAAIAYEMDMRRKSKIAITADTWALAGDPRTARQRHEVLKALRLIPSIVRLEYRQRIGSKYVAHKGLWWSKAPPKVREEEGDDEEV